MTTILADAHLGVMVSESKLSDDDRVWNVRKVFRIHGALVAAAGTAIDCEFFMDWFRERMVAPPEFEFTESVALVLDHDGLWKFDQNVTTLTKLRQRYEAIGTGAKGALCAYEALGFKNPRRAVAIASKYDSASGGPVRLYRL